MVPEPLVEGRSPRRGWMLAAAVVLVLVVGIGAVALVAGRGGGEGGDADAYSLAAASQRTANADTVVYEMTMSVGALGEVRMDGGVDNEAQLMTLTMDMGALSGDDASMEMIVDVGGGVAYVRADEFGEMLPMDAEWFSMDLETLAAMNGESLADLQDQFAVDPTDTATLFQDVEAVEVGIEEIDGQQVKHYRVDIDVEAALAATPQAQQQLDDAGMAGELPDTITYDVWVTEDNQLRRLTFELPVMGETMRTQLDMTSVDEPLEVEIPTGDAVADITDLIGS
jgi:hypothetical protein